MPGTFNPPTRAHCLLARTSLIDHDAVLFVLPREFPHKGWEGARFEDRIAMLLRIAENDSRYGIAVPDSGLCIDMGREARALWPEARIDLVCGRDAADRIAGWDYGEPGVFERMLDEFGLLVAPRDGRFAYPHESVRQLETGVDLTEISATEVRRRIRAGEPWRELVPVEIQDAVERLYG